MNSSTIIITKRPAAGIYLGGQITDRGLTFRLPTGRVELCRHDDDDTNSGERAVWAACMPHCIILFFTHIKISSPSRKCAVRGHTYIQQRSMEFLKVRSGHYYCELHSPQRLYVLLLLDTIIIITPHHSVVIIMSSVSHSSQPFRCVAGATAAAAVLLLRAIVMSCFFVLLYIVHVTFCLQQQQQQQCHALCLTEHFLVSCVSKGESD